MLSLYYYSLPTPSKHSTRNPTSTLHRSSLAAASFTDFAMQANPTTIFTDPRSSRSHLLQIHDFFWFCSMDNEDLCHGYKIFATCSRVLEVTYSIDVIEFQYEYLKTSVDPLSKTFDALQQDFYYDCCDSNFHCLAALKNTKDYMDGIKHLNESSYLVLKQKLSWFTEERYNKPGIVDESNRKITEEMGDVFGTVNLWVKQNAYEVFSITPVDSKWSTKGKKDAYVKMMILHMVRKIGIDSELFHFAKRIATKKNMDKLFMQVDDATGLKLAAKVGLEVIPTVTKTNKILLGKNLTG